ncbi:MAG: tripartite tricarboxylate transporter TctB family protein [Brevinema sp.]
MENKELRKFDLAFSLVLIVCSIFYAFESIKLFINPFGRKWNLVTNETVAELVGKWNESPALVPFIVSILLLICATTLFGIAVKSGARFKFSVNGLLEKFNSDRELKIFITVLGSLAFYIYILIPICRRVLNIFQGFQGFPFLVATAVYIGFISIVFSKKTKKDVVVGLIVAVVASTVITLLFNKVALVPLP